MADLDDLSYDDVINKDILELMGISDLPEEEKIELYNKILATVQNRVIARVADAMDEATTQEWLEVKKTGDKAKMDQFMISKDIDINKLMLQESLIYKTELAQLATPLRQARAKLDTKPKEE